jgi:hypothetical protein
MLSRSLKQKTPENDGLLWFWIRSCKLTVKRMFTHWLILGLIVGIALILIVVRAYVIDIIPLLQRHIKISVVFIDAFADTFVVLEDIIKVIVRIIQDIAHLFSHKHKVPPFHFIKFIKLNDNELRAILTEYASQTTLYNTGPKALRFLLQTAISPSLCPVARSLTPTKINKISSFLFSWLIFNPDPHLNSNSCVANTQFLSVDILAASSAAGFILIEIVIPVYFSLIILYTLSWPTFCVFRRVYQQAISTLTGF